MPTPTATDKKRIAKNTLALYVRMLFVMAVTLYTSRIILEKLGVTEYGVYYAVGGVVAMLGFLNNTLSIGTSRFLTFELGSGDVNKLKETFSTAFYTHLVLAIGVSLILVLGGSWFVLNKLIIPNELKTAALWTFYISVFTAFISITQVPYTSIIIAHEKMNIYAYMGIYDACAKLGIAYAISLAPIQKLVWYAILVAVVQLSSIMIYRIYCVGNYKESHLLKKFNKNIFKNMMGFSGWNLLANIAQILGTNGRVVIINMFFAPSVAAAQAIGNQIAGAMSQFAGNFITAINPQIIKLYASGDKAASRQLNLQTTVLVWDLMLLIGLPLIVCMEPIIHLWLKDVPPYAVVFAQYIVGMQIICTFDNTFYTPMVASGKLKDNSMAALWFGIGGFIVLYFLLKSGLGVMWVQYVAVLICLISSFGVKPLILYRKIGYSFKELTKCYFQCFKSAVIPVSFCIIITKIIDGNESIWQLIATILLIIVIVIVSSFIFMNNTTRNQIVRIIRTKLNIQQHNC